MWQQFGQLGAFVALVTFVRAMTTPARAINTNGLVELLVRPLGPLRSKAGVTAVDDWSYPDFQELRHANIGMAVTGWTMGNYAGFPILHFYSTLPFVLIALLGKIFPMTIAFKLVTLAGPTLLPVAAAFLFR